MSNGINNMIVVGLSDIHGQTSYIDRISSDLCQAGLAVLAGDITHFEGISKAETVVDAVLTHCKRLLAVSGNCDKPGLDQWLINRGQGLHAMLKVIDGIAFAGLGGSVFTPFNTPNEYSEARAGQFLERAVLGLAPDTPLVLVSHQPPTGTACDRIRSGKHVGSRMLRKFIESRRPIACFSGHIHESVAIDHIGNTVIVNPGPFWRGRYAYAKIENKTVDMEIRSF
jgi:hypothetical protein